MTEATPQPALVSFVVVAYNQQPYIREAVEAAFSQTHAPLEIVLSDDCSTDRTYAIMTDLAAAYRGPHTLVMNRNAQNLGLAAHLNAAANLCRGDILVLAAGDDVAHPDRTATLVDMFRARPNAFAVFSAFHDTGTRAAARGTIRAARRNAFEIVFNGGGVGKGATYAYRRACFLWPRPIPGAILSEDKFLPFRAALLGDVFEIDAPLVAYRRPPGRLGDRLKSSGQVARKRPEHVAALRRDADLAAAGGTVSAVYAGALKAVLAYRRLTLAELPERPLILRKLLRLSQRLARSLMRGAIAVLKRRDRMVLKP